VRVTRGLVFRAPDSPRQRRLRFVEFGARGPYAGEPVAGAWTGRELIQMIPTGSSTSTIMGLGFGR
jgi:hypothetical protein